MQGSALLHSLSSCGGSWRDADAAHSQTPARRRRPAGRVQGCTVLQKFLLGIWLSSPWTSEQFGVERKAEAPRGETYPRLQLELHGRAAHSPPRPELADSLLSSGGPHRPGGSPQPAPCKVTSTTRRSSLRVRTAAARRSTTTRGRAAASGCCSSASTSSASSWVSAAPRVPPNSLRAPDPGPRRAVSPQGPAAISPTFGRRAGRELPALPDPQSPACEFKLGRACAFAVAGTTSLGVISSWESRTAPRKV